MSDLNDLELRGFKVIRSQSLYASQKPTTCFLSDPLQYDIVSFTVLRYLTLKLFSFGAIVKINSTSGLSDMDIPDLYQNNRWSHFLELYLDGKFDEDRRKIATCRKFNSFVWQTRWLTHRPSNYLICSMLLMHWAANNNAHHLFVYN